jgi:cyanate lyase
MTRDEIVTALLDGKRAGGQTYAELADELGVPKMWLASAMTGQHPFPPEVADAVIAKYGLPQDAKALMTEPPHRGAYADWPPTDPTVYRFYEVLQVYGPAIKALIHEEFGDGIMSAIAFNMELERYDTEAGDPRVKLTLDGKFLPYKWEA